jgi:ATP-dependent exoDNAse (exonuclease V) beta subunit
VRLAYVAATRARDLIVAPVLGDKPITGWLDVLNPVIYPQEDDKQKAAVASGCPPFGEDSVLDRGPDGAIPFGGSVWPGLHRPIKDGPSVVWWDPAVLKLDVQERAPLRQQRILEADPEGTAARAGEENYSRWKESREGVLAQASRPSISVQTVTTLAREQPGTKEVQVEVVPRPDAERPSGRRFGTLVHSILATVSLDATAEEIRTAAAMHGKLVGANGDEIDAATKTVGAALAHPLMRRAATASTIRRENPALLQLDDGTLAEGTVDLAFHEEGSDFTGWTVVDFKTDLEFQSARAEYSAQVGLYVEAIEKATNLAARGILLLI